MHPQVSLMYSESDDGKMCSFSCAYVLVITLYSYLAPWNIFISSFEPAKTRYRRKQPTANRVMFYQLQVCAFVITFMQKLPGGILPSVGLDPTWIPLKC